VTASRTGLSPLWHRHPGGEHRQQRGWGRAARGGAGTVTRTGKDCDIGAIASKERRW